MTHAGTPQELREGLDLAVVGGGLGGLAAATLAARAGWRVGLFERGAGWGGRARTLDRQNFKVNLGPHALYRRGAARRVLDSLGVAYDGRPPRIRGGLALYEGGLDRLPLGLASLARARFLPWGDKLRLARFMARLPHLDPGPCEPVSVADWLAASGCGPAGRAFLQALVSLTTYSAAPSRLSAGAALAQLRLGQQGVWYLHGGWQTLVDGLLRAAHTAGVRTFARWPVRALELDARGAVCALRDDRAGRVSARAAIVVADPGTALRLARLPADDPWALAVRACEPIEAAALDLGLRRLPRPGAWFALSVGRPVYVSVHSAVARLAPPGGAVLHALSYGDGGAAAPAVRAELEAALDRVQPGWRAEVAYERFLPRLTVAHAQPLAARAGLRGRPAVSVPARPGLFVAGDWVGEEGLLLDASLASAAAAVAAAGDWLRGAQVPAA